MVNNLNEFISKVLFICSVRKSLLIGPYGSDNREGAMYCLQAYSKILRNNEIAAMYHSCKQITVWVYTPPTDYYKEKLADMGKIEKYQVVSLNSIPSSIQIFENQSKPEVCVGHCLRNDLCTGFSYLSDVAACHIIMFGRIKLSPASTTTSWIRSMQNYKCEVS